MAKRKNKSGANMSHEEIWDDTALVRSWDEAVEEYNVCFRFRLGLIYVHVTDNKFIALS
jgi:hypothetical protein